MRGRGRRSPLAGVIILPVLLAAAATGAAAQSPSSQSPPPASGARDFLFGRPDGSLSVRGGWVFARAGSDVFDFVEDRLTVDDGDFNTASFATDYGIAFGQRADVVIGFDYSRAAVASEYRQFVDNNRLPIEQTTTLQEVNLTGSIRFALRPRGRAVGSLAWIPRAVVPYAGAGGGALWYEFKQAGDFVDEGVPPPQPVFTDLFRSKGWTPSAHVFGGVDVRLYHRWFLTFDGRYVWAAADLGDDFERFEPIDLAGFRFGAGINVLF
jgi:hypothetical protein